MKGDGILEGNLYIKHEDSDDILTLGKITNLIGITNLKTDETYEIPSMLINPQKEYTIELENVKWNPYQLYTLLGFQFISNELLADRYQRKRNNKKRIDKKWRKMYGFYEIPKGEVYQMGNKLIAHPKTMKRLIEIMDRMK